MPTTAHLRSSRLRYNIMYLPKILKRIEITAPRGTDLKSWRY